MMREGRYLATGYALAGGQSRRMGQDKALLPYRGATLLDHALSRLREVSEDVRILCGPAPRYEELGVKIETDPGIGPLGAVLAGLEASALPASLFLAVDLPEIPTRLLAQLFSWLAGHDAVVPYSAKGAEPLCAVYSAECRPAIRASIEGGQLKMTSFFPKIRVRTVSLAELREFGDPDTLFRNLNTPEEFGRI